MRVYLVQHGDAVSKEVDPDRPLSEKGRLDVGHIADFLRGRVRVARVLHSGKTRARQTAEIIAKAIAAADEIQPIAGIDPLDPTEPIAQQIQQWTNDTSVVGHLPFMGKLATRLVTGMEEPLVVDYQPGTVLALERSTDVRWTIAWMLRPELFAN